MKCRPGDTDVFKRIVAQVRRNALIVPPKKPKTTVYKLVFDVETEPTALWSHHWQARDKYQNGAATVWVLLCGYRRITSNNTSILFAGPGAHQF